MNKIEVTRTIVPASPGWFLATLAPSGTALNHDGIIAWDITRVVTMREGHDGRLYPDVEHQSATPLTLSNKLRPLYDPFAVKRPDGTYEMEGDHGGFTEAVIIEELRFEHETNERLKEDMRPPPQPRAASTS